MSPPVSKSSQSGAAHKKAAESMWISRLDVGAKLIAAVAVASVTWIVKGYESKLSATTLLNQREQAETNLRAAMLHDLTEPIIGNPSRPNDIEPDHQRLLVELLTLNFHDHFEFKPLLVEVHRRLEGENHATGRRSLESIARRVIDRQINLLRAVGESMGERATVESMFFLKSDSLPEESFPPPGECDGWAGQSNWQQEPALFGGSISQTVCSAMPDGQYRLKVSVNDVNLEKKTAEVSVGIFNASATETASGNTFTLTPFDFPLTDNTQLDADHRFAIALYHLEKRQDAPPELELKVVWFPKGYITQRERPLNYLEIRRSLGVQG